MYHWNDLGDYQSEQVILNFDIDIPYSGDIFILATKAYGGFRYFKSTNIITVIIQLCILILYYRRISHTYVINLKIIYWSKQDYKFLWLSRIVYIISTSIVVEYKPMGLPDTCN